MRGCNAHIKWQTKKTEKAKVRNIQIKTLVSEEDLTRHGGREEIAKRFRAVRDINPNSTADVELLQSVIKNS